MIAVCILCTHVFRMLWIFSLLLFICVVRLVCCYYFSTFPCFRVPIFDILTNIFALDVFTEAINGHVCVERIQIKRILVNWMYVCVANVQHIVFLLAAGNGQSPIPTDIWGCGRSFILYVFRLLKRVRVIVYWILRAFSHFVCLTSNWNSLHRLSSHVIFLFDSLFAA